MSAENPYRYLLDLVAGQGPLSGPALSRHIAAMGPELAGQMEDALQRLIRSGDILRSQGRAAYFVAPARLVPAGTGDPYLFKVIGHPAAETVLAALGKVAGPDEKGQRYFHSYLALAGLRPRLKRCAIALEVTDP